MAECSSRSLTVFNPYAEALITAFQQCRFHYPVLLRPSYLCEEEVVVVEPGWDWGDSNQCIAIGQNAVCVATNCIAIGESARMVDNLAIGRNAGIECRERTVLGFGPAEPPVTRNHIVHDMVSEDDQDRGVRIGE